MTRTSSTSCGRTWGTTSNHHDDSTHNVQAMLENVNQVAKHIVAPHIEGS